MLSWWFKDPYQQRARRDEDPERDAPETPAPVFAARALKSALFGTPGFPDETVYDPEDDDEDEEEREKPAVTNTTRLLPRSQSPTKPVGILVTPGTATARRKTVSFKNEALDMVKEDVTGEAGRRRSSGDIPSPFIGKDAARSAANKSEAPESLGKVPTQWPSRPELVAGTRRKTSLTRTMENARTGNTPKSDRETAANPSKTIPQEEVDIALQSTSHTSKVAALLKSQDEKPAQRKVVLPRAQTSTRHTDGDRTLDLNQPHSKSGQFWKSSYEQYHEEAKMEMAKLVKYKLLANTYAKKKDDEASELAEKLENAQDKINKMESKITQLSNHIAVAEAQGDDDTSPELVQEFARRTALAEQYKGQVKEFREAMEEFEAAGVKRGSHGDHGSSDQGGKGVRSLRSALSSAERKNRELQEENTKLTNQILLADLKLEKHLENCDKKRHSFEHKISRRDETVLKLQNDYDKMKNIAKSQRRDAEHLLKRKHERSVEQRKEIARLKEENAAMEERDEEQKQAIANLQKELRELKYGLPENPPATALPSRLSRHQQIENSPFQSFLSEKDLLEIAPAIQDLFPTVPRSPTRASGLPVLSRPSKAMAPPPNPRTTTPSKSPKRPLSEIINSATRTIDAVPTPRYGPVTHTPILSAPVSITPLASRFSNLSIGTPGLLQLPSLEPTPDFDRAWGNGTGNLRGTHERNCGVGGMKESPRPKMVNIPSSPPKPVVMRSRMAGGVSKKSSASDLGSRSHNTKAPTSDLGIGSRHAHVTKKENRPPTTSAAPSDIGMTSSKIRKENNTPYLPTNDWIKEEERGKQERDNAYAGIEARRKLNDEGMASLHSSRVRGNLPPERVAAAKKRLEERRRKKEGDEGVGTGVGAGVGSLV